MFVLGWNESSFKDKCDVESHSLTAYFTFVKCSFCVRLFWNSLFWNCTFLHCLWHSYKLLIFADRATESVICCWICNHFKLCGCFQTERERADIVLKYRYRFFFSDKLTVRVEQFLKKKTTQNQTCSEISTSANW